MEEATGKRFMRIFPVLLVFLLCTCPLQAQQAGTGQDSEASAPSEVAVKPTAQDQQIRQRLADILRAAGWFQSQSVIVREGIVFLEGVTDSEPHRKWAGDLARNTQDVVAVVNNIQVQPEFKLTLTPAFAELEKLGESTIAALPLIVLALLLLPVFWLLSRYTRRLVRWIFRNKVRSPLILNVIGMLAGLPVLLLGFYIVLQIAGLTSLAVSILGGAGVIGIVLGFAFRDIVENFLSGILLSIRQPFQRGDFINVAGYEGVVDSLNSRSTVLISLEGNHIIIPNAAVFKNVITNFSTARFRRETLDVGIGYDDSVAQTQEVITGVLGEHEAVRNDPPPMVLVHSLGAATVNIRIYFWFDGHDISALKLKSALYRLIKRALTVSGISMPDEAREVVFPQGVPIHQIALAEAGKTVPATANAAMAVAEPEPMESAAEADLSSEEDDAEAQAARSGPPEGDRNTLPDGGGLLPRTS
jgi:small-conductance mechanosensitive channel